MFFHENNLTNLNYFVHKIVFGLINILKMFKSASSKPKILIAPLNWGLGHASRCIPIIKSLLANESEVIVACGDSQKHYVTG